MKKISTRVIQKNDLEVNWLNAKTFIPFAGEIIIYNAEVDDKGNTLQLPEGRTEPYTYARVKIGNGYDTVIDLPFVDEALREEILSQDIVVLAEAQAYTDNKVSGLSAIASTGSTDDLVPGIKEIFFDCGTAADILANNN